VGSELAANRTRPAPGQQVLIVHLQAPGSAGRLPLSVLCNPQALYRRSRRPWRPWNSQKKALHPPWARFPFASCSLALPVAGLPFIRRLHCLCIVACCRRRYRHLHFLISPSRHSIPQLQHTRRAASHQQQPTIFSPYAPSTSSSTASTASPCCSIHSRSRSRSSRPPVPSITTPPVTTARPIAHPSRLTGLCDTCLLANTTPNALSAVISVHHAHNVAPPASCQPSSVCSVSIGSA